ncbi:MAG TPA: tetratricopeptide repeat protein [Thermoanaerobaculia bacterium]|nr:tetratricopeptide repeat protein [Thermoanaerobaculia bacterium]
MISADLGLARTVLGLLRELASSARSGEARVPDLLRGLRPEAKGDLGRPAGQIEAAWQQASALAPVSEEAKTLCIDLALAAPDFAPFLLGGEEWSRWLVTAISWADARGNRPATARLRAALANLRLSTSDTAGAAKEAETALAEARGLGDPQAVARSLALVGMAAADTGNLPRAEEAFSEALRIAADGSYAQLRADLLGDLGTLLFDAGRSGEARMLQEEALAFARSLGDRRGESRHLGNLAILEKRRGRLDLAEQLYRDQLVISRKLRDERQEAIATYNLGLTFAQTGRGEDAEQAYKRAYLLRRRQGDAAGVFGALNALGILYKDRGRFDTARKVQARCLKIARRLGDRERLASVLANLGRLDLLSKNLEAAERNYAESERLAEELGNRWSQGIAASGQAAVAEARGDLPAAIGHLERALPLHRLGGEIAHVGSTLLGLAQLSGNLGDELRAVEFSREAIEVFHDLGDRRRLWRVVFGLCDLAERMQALDRCRNWIEEGLLALEALGDPEVESVRRETGLSRLL